MPPEGTVVGADGLLRRVDKVWAQEKLHYIERYINIFSTGMKRKWSRRVYIDLFSGPGRSQIEGSNTEIDGSPLRALRARDPFTVLYLNDAEPDVVESLRARVPDSMHDRVILSTRDCNDAALDAANVLFDGPEANKTIGLAVIDPTGFQISFRSIEIMTKDRRIDLLITFMTGHLRRFLSEPSLHAALDSFFGSLEWRELVGQRARGEKVTYRDLLDLYQERLRTLGYRHVSDHIRILNTRDMPLYHLVFASKHERGDDFFYKISGRGFSGQQRMELG